jgi:hypothetical protein
LLQDLTGIIVCIPPTDHPKLSVLNGLEFNRGKSLGKVFLKCGKSVITMHMKIPFDCSSHAQNLVCTQSFLHTGELLLHGHVGWMLFSFLISDPGQDYE